MSTQTATPRIYVASLSDYVAGRLVGQWIDLDETTTADDIQEAITAMLATSPEPLAEEWAIHDYDEMPNLGEYPDLETVATAARGIAEHGEPFRAWVELHAIGWIDADPDGFQEQYLGEYEDEKDYAYEYVESTGMFDGVNESISNYFDYDAFARDLFMDLDSAPAPGGGIYVFDPNA